MFVFFQRADYTTFVVLTSFTDNSLGRNSRHLSVVTSLALIIVRVVRCYSIHAYKKKGMSTTFSYFSFFPLPLDRITRIPQIVGFNSPIRLPYPYTPGCRLRVCAYVPVTRTNRCRTRCRARTTRPGRFIRPRVLKTTGGGVKVVPGGRVVP